MVKSLRYDQANSPDDFWFVVIDRVRHTGHAHAHVHAYGYSTPDRDTAPHGHTNTGLDLPRAESGGRVGAARSV